MESNSIYLPRNPANRFVYSERIVFVLVYFVSLHIRLFRLISRSSSVRAPASRSIEQKAIIHGLLFSMSVSNSNATREPKAEKEPKTDSMKNGTPIDQMSGRPSRVAFGPKTSATAKVEESRVTSNEKRAIGLVEMPAQERVDESCSRRMHNAIPFAPKICGTRASPRREFSDPKSSPRLHVLQLNLSRANCKRCTARTAHEGNVLMNGMQLADSNRMNKEPRGKQRK